MLRLLLLPLLALTLLATEAASAQASTTTPTATRKPGRMLTARERRAQDAAARQQTAAQATHQPAVATGPSWSGWSNDPLPETTPAAAPHRTTTSLSVAPGMPINQIGHGVSTDYNGRALAPAVASTTLPSVR